MIAEITTMMRAVIMMGRTRNLDPPTSIYQDLAHHLLTSLSEVEAIDDKISQSLVMNNGDIELHAGMRFRDKHALCLEVKLYSI